jgi:hypothetical protein
MNLDQGNVPQPENSQSSGSVRLAWLLLGIVPIPIGLLIGPVNIFNSIQGSNKSSFEGYAVITAILGLASGIGVAGGFRSRKIVNIVGGIFTGLLMAGFSVFVVFFVGCSVAFSHI